MEGFYKKYTDLVQLNTFYENEIREQKSNNIEYLKTIK